MVSAIPTLLECSPQRLDLFEQPQDNLDAGRVQSEVVPQPTNPSQSSELRFAEQRHPALDPSGPDESRPNVAPHARWWQAHQTGGSFQ